MTDITKQSTEELLATITAQREALRAIRFGTAGSRARNVHEAEGIRKNIARMLTELSSRKIALSAKQG